MSGGTVGAGETAASVPDRSVARGRASSASRCSRAGARSERKVSLRSGAQAQGALARLGHDVVAIDAGPELVAQLREAKLDAAFIALHGRDGEDGTVQGLLEAIGIPYTGSGPSACMRCTDKVLAKHLMREAGIPTPDFHFFRETSFKELGAAAALGGRRARPRLPAGRQAREPGLGAGRQVRALERGAAGRDRGRALLRSHGPDRALREGPRPGGVGARLRDAGRASPWRCRWSRRFRARRTSTTTSPAMRSA